MRILKKCIAGLLVLSFIGLYLPKNSYCAGSGLFAKTDKKSITRHEPKIMSTPEKDIPLEKAAKEGEKKGFNWLLIGAGAALVLGLAAAGGGGGGGDGPGPTPADLDTGSITVGW